jgi:hypothetical protein
MLSIGRSLFAFLAYATLGRFALGPAIPLMPERLGPRALPVRRTRGYRPRGILYAPNGKREVARRLRQIAAGQLRVSP